MKNELLIFESLEFGQVRTMEVDGEPYFVGKDVAEILGYVNTKDAISKHVDEEDKIRGSQNVTPSIKTSGGMQYPTLINESGLYSLIFSSKMPKAKEFKHWVTNEVLPAIRKTGKYEINKNTYMPTRELTTDDYVEAAKTVSKCHNSRLALVLGLYRMAGFDIPEITRRAKEQEYISKEDFTALMNRYSLEELKEKLNFDRVTIWRYKTGQYRPREPRLHQIVDTLTGEM
ncbi:MAG: Bro-N domain-containing protein [Clostridiales bacterium]|nr:Bro-N domain-containing protein [Clostridiales bacterium]